MPCLKRREVHNIATTPSQSSQIFSHDFSLLKAWEELMKATLRGHHVREWKLINGSFVKLIVSKQSPCRRHSMFSAFQFHSSLIWPNLPKPWICCALGICQEAEALRAPFASEQWWGCYPVECNARGRSFLPRSTRSWMKQLASFFFLSFNLILFALHWDR